jgi:hypothetical protein
MFSPFLAQMRGESGVTIRTLREATERLIPDPEDEVRQYLPRHEPTTKNTIAQLERSLSALGKRSVKVTAHRLSGGRWSGEAHFSGLREGSEEIDLSAEVWRVALTFDEEGKVATATYTPSRGSKEETRDLLERGVEHAQETLNSKAWSDSWTRLGRAWALATGGALTYMVTRPRGGELFDRYIAVAQSCGICAYRADQPQFALQESIKALIAGSLSDAKARLEGSAGQASARLSTSRLKACEDLAETITALRSILGESATQLDSAVEHLRDQWTRISEMSDEAPPKTAPKLQMIALTKQGRATLEALRGAQGAIIASTSALRGQQAKGPAAQGYLDLVLRGPLPYRSQDADTLRALLGEGLIEGVDATPIAEALGALSRAPIPVTEADVEAMRDYAQTLTRTFSE